MKVSKSQSNRNFPKGLNHGKPWQKNRMFSRWYFLIKLSQMRLFFDIVDRKECFLDLRREILKAQKNGNFPQRLVHGFCPKFECFRNRYFFGETLLSLCKKHSFYPEHQKNSSFDILDRKECFLNQKSEILKKLEKSKFSAWLGLSRLRS